MQIPDAVRTVVDTAPFAHLTTLNADGGPQVTIVWVDIEGDEFMIGHMGDRRKTKSGRHATRVAQSVRDRSPRPRGLRGGGTLGSDQRGDSQSESGSCRWGW